MLPGFSPNPKTRIGQTDSAPQSHADAARAGADGDGGEENDQLQGESHATLLGQRASDRMKDGLASRRSARWNPMYGPIVSIKPILIATSPR